MNGVDILSKTISNEISISKGKLPKFILSQEEEKFLKSIVEDLNQSELTIYNTAKKILISNGETKKIIWNLLEEELLEKTHGDWNHLVIGTNLKWSTDPSIPVITIQWLLNRLHEKGANLKIYQPQRTKMVTGYNVYPVTTIIKSLKDVDFYLDFNCYEIPLKYQMRYENLIFSL